VAAPVVARLASTLRASRRTTDPAETDGELLGRFVQSRDEAAFRALVDRHAKTVLAACRQVLTDPADIDDAFQAAFVVLFRRAKKAAEVASLGGWLFAVTHRVSVRCRADNSRRQVRETIAARRARTTAEPPDASVRELSNVLHAELNALPDKYRLPLILCCVRGLSRDEAAAELGCTFEAVRWALERGRTLLQKRLTKRGVALSVGLLAAVVGGANAAGVPSPELITLAVRAATGGTSPAALALAHGAFPMVTLKRTVVSAVLTLALIASGIGVGVRPPSATADEKPVMKAEKPGETKDAKPEKPTSIGGTVTGSDGKAVGGASVFVGYYRTGGMWAPGQERTAGTKVATTDADGKFTADVPKEASPYFWVYATKPGQGAAWVYPEYPSRTLKDPLKLALKMPADVTITGKVLNIEGKAVAGATVGVYTLMDPAGRDFDKFLKGAANGGFGSVGQWDDPLHPPAELFGVTTDADGKFEMRGVGADRIVMLVVSGKGIARMSGMVLTRKGVKVDPLNKQPGGSTIKGKGRHPVFYGPEPTFVVEPGYALEGVVTDAKTGQPVPGSTLDVSMGYWDRVTAVTDKDGKYRVDGLSKGGGHYVHALPPTDRPLFPTFADVREPDGFATATLNFPLARGAVFAGRAIDKRTKQPVAAAFQIIPAADNEYAKKPEYETANRDMVWKGGSADGKFSIVTLPGKSNVNINVEPTETLNGRPLRVHVAGQKMTIDLKEEGNGEVLVEVERGAEVPLTAADADGKPLTGVVTCGQSMHDHGFLAESEVHPLPADEAKFTVYGLNTKEVRPVVAIHPAKKLGGAKLVTAKSEGQLVLRPLQPVRGTFTDADGTPLAGVVVTIDYTGYGMGELFREHAPKWKMSATTDKDGKFEIPDVISGVPFSFDAKKGSVSYRGTPRLGQQTVPSGKPLELGVRKLEEIQD
jgi:RNA polymerase sigma factor (sigma-70 family)